LIIYLSNEIRRLCAEENENLMKKIQQSSYRIPAGVTFYEQEIKRSKFLTWIAPADSPDIAKQWIQSIKEQYPDARHVCWAYIAGAPDTFLKSMSDDGEPSGTAGKPMLNVLEHSEVGDIAVAVVRYFGGIKLGTGGLARAYSSSVSEAIKQAEYVMKIAMEDLSLSFPYAEESQVRYLLSEVDGKVGDLQYGDLVTLSCSVPSQYMDEFKQRLGLEVVINQNE